MATTVLYDADCGLCSTAARLLARRGSLHLAPIQSSLGSSLLDDLDLESRLDSFHLITPDGTRYSGGQAVPPLARALPAGRLTAPLLARFPSTIDRGYRLVARNRRRVSALLGLNRCKPKTDG